MDCQFCDKRPLKIPARRPTARPIASIANVSAPARARHPMKRLESEMMEATDISMSPSRMTNIMGMAITAFSMKLKVASKRLKGSRKYGESRELPTKTAMKIKKSIDSQRRRKSASRLGLLIIVRREESTKPVPRSLIAPSPPRKPAYCGGPRACSRLPRSK